MNNPRRFDVCNGDADGLCAVVQWRIHSPVEATLITGLKREIELLQKVDAQRGDEVLVCDLSMQRNGPALIRLLDRGVRVRYFDHHDPGPLLQHAGLEVHIEASSGTCASLLVDRELGGLARPWALVGAYGDNLTALADKLAAGLGLDDHARARLRMLGEALNYNAYGDDERDVHTPPAKLYSILARYRNPLDMVANEPLVHELDEQRRADLKRAAAVGPHWQRESAEVILLPDESWSRRVMGCLANQMSKAQPFRAHAVVRPTQGGELVVSVRAPLSAPSGADTLAGRFGGSGRAAAAGIDHLAPADLERFANEFCVGGWWSPAA